MINIAEKLKDCPQGIKFYSPLFGEVELVRIDMENPRFPIIVKVLNDESPFSNVTFTAEGKWYSFKQSECLLFPSKNTKAWNKFRIPVKKGDIMMIPNSYHAFITTGEFTDNGSVMFICGVDEDNEFIINPGNAGWTKGFYIPASGKAKKRLFDKMKAAGYRWNANTLELEKIELLKQEFKPFDKVLVRDYIDEKWILSIFSCYEDEDKDFPYVCLNGRYCYCIPYEGNEHLLNTPKSPKDN